MENRLCLYEKCMIKIIIDNRLTLLASDLYGLMSLSTSPLSASPLSHPLFRLPLLIANEP